MKAHELFLLLLLATNLSLGQSTFKLRLESQPFSSNDGYLLKEFAGGYFVVATTLLPREKNNRLWLIVVDKQGTPTKAKLYSLGHHHHPLLVQMKEVAGKPEFTLLVEEYKEGSFEPRDRRLWLLVVDEDLKELSRVQIKQNLHHLFRADWASVIEKPNPGYLVGGSTHVDGDLCDRAWLAKIDSDGNVTDNLLFALSEECEGRFAKSTRFSFPYARQAPDHPSEAQVILSLVRRKDNEKEIDRRPEQWLMRIKWNSHEILSQKTLKEIIGPSAQEEAYEVTSGSLLSDGLVALVGRKRCGPEQSDGDSQERHPVPQAWAGKLDLQSEQFKWKRDFGGCGESNRGQSTLVSVAETEQHHLVFAGNCARDDKKSSLIVRIHGDTGNDIWSRALWFNSLHLNNFARFGIGTENSGTVIVGASKHRNILRENSNVLVMKSDATGLFHESP